MSDDKLLIENLNDNLYRKGFNKGIYASITMEIHRQIGALKKEGYMPSLICLGHRASMIFAKEHWADPFKRNTWPESYLNIPIQYNSRKISGVFLEGKK